MRHRWIIVAALTVAITGVANAQWRHQLKVGDPAPKLDIERWAHGEEVPELEKGQVYIVEFWATWCVPCRQVIPLLSNLQRRYGDDGLVVVGVSNEKYETVRSFVLRNPALFAYPVAVDRDENTTRSWMQAAGQEGIPTAFLVDREGRVQYVGHPRGDNFELILRLVLQGRYDARLFREVGPAIEAYERARRVRNWRLADTHLRQIVQHDPHIFAEFNIQWFEMKLVDMNNKEEAYQFANELMKKYAHDAAFLVELARHIAVEPKLETEHRDLAIAMEIAKAAQKASQEDPSVLSTLALVHFHQGNLDEALRHQRRAWMIAPPSRKPGYQRTLRTYQEAHQRSARAELSGNRD